MTASTPEAPPLAGPQGPTAEPGIMPCLLLRRGRVCRRGPDGPEPALGPDRAPLDPFDVIDRLTPDYRFLYVVDLDGIERGEPQLDYLQEFSRDITLWVDGGVRTGDQFIDIVVAGASRAVVSSATLAGPRELRRAWRLSTELAFEIASEDGTLLGAGPWETQDPVALARTVRAAGPTHFVIASRDRDPDWGLVRSIASGSPTWVGGTFELKDADRLKSAGAAGGIFHIDGLLDAMAAQTSTEPTSRSSSDVRDDDD